MNKIVILGLSLLMVPSNIIGAGSSPQSINTTFHEGVQLTNNMLKNHPFIIGLLTTLLSYELTQKSPRNTIRRHVFDACYFQHGWKYQALICGTLIDIIMNRNNACASQALTACHDILRTYSTCSNTEFIKKSMRWFSAQLQQVRTTSGF